MNKTFEILGLKEEVTESINNMGITNPSKIQESIIPLILGGFDVIGKAQTGTGKTLAYASSILSLLDKDKKNVSTIVLVPTRELAVQVCDEFEKINESSKFKIMSVYGSSSITEQIKKLQKHIDIVVGTPGRIMDLMRRKVLKLNDLKFFVLDEADEMLNMGFSEDIETIFKETKKEKQVLLFSATMPEKILSLAKNYMKNDYKLISIDEVSKTSINVTHYYYQINEKTRLEALARVIDSSKIEKCIIFCRTKKDCDNLLDELSNRNYSVEVIHGDIIQKSRIEAIERFKRGNFKFLIATDVVARGIHIDNVDCVINYNLPEDIESYIHRIGRTGRVENTGISISFVTNKELSFLKTIEKITKCEITKCELPEVTDIIKNKYEKILEDVKKVLEDKTYTEAINYVRDLNKTDLINLSSALLKLTVSKEIGSDLNKKIEITDNNNKRKQSKGTVRVFLTIGKMDNINKKDFSDTLSKITSIDKANFKNIEILTKFTFMDVNEKYLDEVISKLNNKKINNRTVRIERAKK